MKIQRTIIPKDQTFLHRGVLMNYKVIGIGKPVVLLHGSMIHNPWQKFETELAKNYQVYLPHLPGFGGSDAIDGKVHSTELFSIGLASFLKHTKLENAPVIAFSLGTVIAVSAAAAGTLKGQLILVGVPGKIEGRILAKANLIPLWLRRQICSTSIGRKKILMPLVRDIIGNDAKNEDINLLEELAITDTRALVDLDIFKDVVVKMEKLLPQITNKVVFIYGEHDRLHTSTTHLVKDPLVIEGADHNPFTSQPTKLLSTLIQIIEKNY